MLDRVMDARQAVQAARGKVLAACIVASGDQGAIDLMAALMALEMQLRVAEFIAEKAHTEALAIKVTRSHSTAAPEGKKHGA